MKLTKYVLPLLFVIFLVFGNANAQVTDDPILKACEETADKLKEANVKVQGLENENKLLKEMLALKDDKIAIVTEQKDFYKKAYENSTKIDSNSELIIQNLRFQVNDFRAENLDLRKENDKLRSSRNWRTFFGAAAGFGLGYWANNK